MQVVILADEVLKGELLSHGIKPEIELIWTQGIEGLMKQQTADGFIDLLFENNHERIEILKSLSPRPVIVNSVVATLKNTSLSFVRLNAWPGFIGRSVAEASYSSNKTKRKAEEIFSLLNRETEWVADEPGFVTARVIATIINEAYFVFEEGVSSREQIDTAMKLGTNYPHGPFEWTNKIGAMNVYMLLQELSKLNPRYKPAVLLEQEAMN